MTAKKGLYYMMAGLLLPILGFITMQPIIALLALMAGAILGGWGVMTIILAIVKAIDRSGGNNE
jgi:hypothetical protein